MNGLSSREKKATTAYHLPEWIIRAIEELAIERGTNKSHEAAKALRVGLAHDPDAQRPPEPLTIPTRAA